jgi:hypothetical protein
VTSVINRYYDPTTGSFTSSDPDVAETGQPYAYAADDPVDNVDPLGLCNNPSEIGYYPGACATTGAGALKAEAYIQGHAGSSWGWSFTQALHSEANYAAGVANGLVSTVTFGQVNVPEPYCDALSWAYGTGTGFGIAGSLVGGGVVAGTISGAAGAADAADEGSSGLADGWRGTNMTDEESFDYHYGAHGAGETPEQYAQDAREWAANPAGAGSPVTLADGSAGTVFRTAGGGPGGILDSSGNIISFWYR